MTFIQNKARVVKVVILGVLCFLFTAHSYSRSLEDIEDSGFVIVAVYENYAPFSYKDKEQPRGIDVEIAQEIADALDVELRLLWMTPDETVVDDLRNAIWKGHIIHRTKADIMMRAPYDRAFAMQRDDLGLLVNELVHIFGPYHTESWKVLHSVERLPDLTTMNYFAYHPVGTEIDSVPHFYLSSSFGGRFQKNVTQYKTIEGAVDNLKAGNVDAVMGIGTQMFYHLSQLPAEQYAIAQMGFPQLAVQSWDIGMAVHNDFRALAYTTGDVITALLNSGKLEQIFNHYNAPLTVPSYYQQ